MPEVVETLVGELTSLYEEQETKHGPELMRGAEQLVMLRSSTRSGAPT